MSDIRVEVKDYELVNFLSTPIGIVSTDFRLTKAEKDVIMYTDFNEPRGHGDGVLVSNNHNILDLPELDRPKAFIENMTKDFVASDLKINNEFYMTSSWATLNEKGCKHHNHAHPNTLLSAVYYVNAESGQLVINSPTNGLFPNFDFKFDVKEYNIFNSKSWKIDVKTGDLVIFPGWLHHYTTPNEHENPRVIIGANFFTRGKFGKYEDTDLIEV